MMNQCAYCKKDLSQVNGFPPKQLFYLDDNGVRYWFDSLYCKTAYQESLKLMKGAVKFLTEAFPFGGW